MDVIPANVVDDGRKVLLKSQAEPINCAQGRSQIVRDRIAEGLKLAVNAFEFGRTNTHTILKCFV